MTSIEEITGMKNAEGQVRGVAFQTDAHYVERTYGKEGLAKVEARLKQLDVPLTYRTVKATEWYPVYMRAASLLIIKEVLGLSDDDIRQMGLVAPKVSFFMRTMIHLFSSPEMILKNADIFWQKHFNKGKLVFQHFDPAGNASLILKDFAVHPVLCRYFEGFFVNVVRLTTITDPNSKCVEKKCVHNGDAGHEFWIYWKP